MSTETASDFEKLWFGYHALVSTLSASVGLYGYAEQGQGIGDSGVIRSGSTLSAVPLVTAADKRSALFAKSLQSAPASSLRLGDREAVASHRAAIDSLSTLIGMAMAQNHTVSDLHMPQFAVASDAVVAFLAAQGLCVESAAERRLIHRCLGIAKAAQFAICIWDDRHTNTFFAANAVGLGLCFGATYRWGVSKKAKSSFVGVFKRMWNTVFGVARETRKKIKENKAAEAEAKKEAKKEEAARAAVEAPVIQMTSVESPSVADEVVRQYLRKSDSMETLAADVELVEEPVDAGDNKEYVEELDDAKPKKSRTLFVPRSDTLTFNTSDAWSDVGKA